MGRLWSPASMSSDARKFGTFGGVFTPSILTILGVIMYLRLPTIVGQGGLWMTLGIITIAHVISVTTGLSIASIATDKRVRAGGSYYMISRSLGLPIGGTLGIALFVGMSLSISLYLIGFSESFLGYWGFPQDKNTIRITGSIALLVVSVVTLISTSFALKTQYLIMAAIVASLATVLAGGFMQSAPLHPHLTPATGAAAVGFGALFGIFFPAVTGFEAGVSMSGDLRDPKKAIPIGTIAAIAVGFLVYLGLAVFLAFRVDARGLAEDGEILSKVSAFAPLLVAGVWGATISSALGSILGAPRILQAASADRITHRFFTRGYGPTSEPRNALLLTIALAEAGIMIGELDVIARIVSMFFITAYGFLNLACAVESWASPDFRPDFKIPKSISLIGALTCVVIMIQLDILAMIGASAVMGVLFVYLKRRELTLEGGDTYEGIWSTIVRRGLYNLSRSTVHQRNWRPNMLLFSGGEDERPGLVAIARDLAQGRGMISNFDLEETSSPRIRPRRDEAVPPDSPDAEGIFTRVLQCSDVYESMEQIARYHGFSGIEPNTVLLGRAHSRGRAEKFATLVAGFSDLDYNTLLYDEGPDPNLPPKRVDVWWSGFGNNLAFGLSLVRFLQGTDRWRRAKLRFLIIADDAGLAERYRGRLSVTIESMRVAGEIRVIFNGVERRDFAEIIARESGESDLVLLGIPDFSREPAENALSRMNEMTASLRQVLWMRASSYFPAVGVERHAVPAKATLSDETMPQLVLPATEPLRSWLASFAPRLSDLLEAFHARHFVPAGERRVVAMERLAELAERTYDSISQGLRSGATQRRAISHFHGSFLHQARVGLVSEQDEDLPLQEGRTAAGDLNDALSALLADAPPTLAVMRPVDFFVSGPTHGAATRARNAFRRTWARLAGGTARVEVPCRSVIAFQLRLKLPRRITILEKQMAQGHYDLVAATHRILARVDVSLRALEVARRQGSLTQELIALDRHQVVASIRAESEEAARALSQTERMLQTDARRLLNRVGAEMDHPDVRRRMASRRVSARSAALELGVLSAAEGTLRQNRGQMTAMLAADLDFFFMRNRLRGVVERCVADAGSAIRGVLLGRLKRVAESGGSAEGVAFPHQAGSERPFSAEDFSSSLMSQLRPILAELPEEQLVLTADSVERWEKGEFHSVSSVNVAVRRYVESLCESDFAVSVRSHADALERVAQEGRSALALVLSSTEPQESEEPGPGETPETPATARIRLTGAATELETALDHFETRILSAIENIGDRLSAFFFVHAPESIELFVRESERRFLRARIRRAFQGTRRFVANVFGRVLLGRSRAAVLAHRIEAQSSEVNRVSLLQDLREACTPRSGAVAQLPRYYKYLFLEKTQPSREFWVGRREELKEFSRSVARFRSGFGGAVFVTGPPESGKTWFSRFAAERHFPTAQIVEVFTKDGSPSRGAFETALERAFAGSAASFPKGGCAIINDVELLWERRPEGYDGLRAVLETVERVGRETLFVINVNVDAFRLMRQTISLESQTARAIELGPFSAEELRDIVLSKHNVSGYGMQMDAVHENGLSVLQSARFFDAIFVESTGLPGPALRAYVRSIKSVEDNVVQLQQPGTVSDSVIRDLPPSWKLILGVLLMHRRLRAERLLALCEPIDANAAAILSALRHARFLIPAGSENWRLEPAVVPHVRGPLHEEGIL